MTAVDVAPANVFERYMSEDVNLGNSQFDEKAENIKMARHRMISRIIIEKSPDDKSNMSKSRRGTKVRRGTTKDIAPSMYGGASAGRGSINDSMQEMSDQFSASPLNQSISRKKNKDENKAKPRDFNIDPPTLTILNAHKYDKMDDMT